MNQIFRELQADAVLGLDRKSVVLPSRKILISLFQLMFFGFEKKKQQKSSLTSLFKLPDKTLSKEMMNLLISGSVSSLHLNCKHLANVTQQAIAWRYGCVPDGCSKRFVLSLGNFKDSQNTFFHRHVVQSGKKADGSLSTPFCLWYNVTVMVKIMRVSSRPMRCKMAAPMIEGSNVSTPH